MSNVYGKKFFRVLKEDLDIDPEKEKAALASSLDKETNPDDFLVDAPTQDLNASVQQAVSQREQQMMNQLQGWISTMEEFRDFLNGQDPNSVQKALASAESETILDKMRNAEQRKIARVATELAALIESFKGYIAQAGNSNLKYV